MATVTAVKTRWIQKIDDAKTALSDSRVPISATFGHIVWTPSSRVRKLFDVLRSPSKEDDNASPRDTPLLPWVETANQAESENEATHTQGDDDRRQTSNLWRPLLQQNDFHQFVSPLSSPDAPLNSHIGGCGHEEEHQQHLLTNRRETSLECPAQDVQKGEPSGSIQTPVADVASTIINLTPPCIEPLIPDLSSTNELLQIPLKRPHTEKLSRNCYMDKKAEVSDLLMQRWNDDIKRRLDQDLREVIGSTSKGVDHILSNTQFSMVGRRHGEILFAKPTIVITCGTRECQKRVTRHLARLDLQYLEDFGCPIKVRYQRAPSYWASSECGDLPLSADRSSQMHIHRVCIQRSTGCTACGLKLRFDEEIDGFVQQKFATLGGIICIKQQIYGLTTGHTFLADLRSRRTTQTLHEGDKSRRFDTNSDTDTESEGSASISESSLHNPRIESKPLMSPQSISVVAYSFAGRDSAKTNVVARSLVTSDWALVEIPPSLALPNLDVCGEILSIIPDNELSSGSVNVLCGAGTSCHGFLTQGKATIQTQQSIMDVREVLLDEPLVDGVSGSWIVRNSQLCGYIVAVTKRRLSCFMIGVEPTFQDIEAVIDAEVELAPVRHSQQVEPITVLESHPLGILDSARAQSKTEMPNEISDIIQDPREIYTKGPDFHRLCSSQSTSHELEEHLLAGYPNEPNDDEFDSRYPTKDQGRAIRWLGLKIYGNILIIIILTTFSTSGFTMIAPAVPGILEAYKSSNETLGSLVVSIYVLGFIAGPLLVAPLSESCGRLVVYHCSNFLLTICNIIAPLSPSLNFLIAIRFVAGSAAVGSLTVIGSSIEDMTKDRERTRYIHLVSFIGPIIGYPVGSTIGGWVAQRSGWRWVFGASAIFGASSTAASIAILHESHEPTIRRRWRGDRWGDYNKLLLSIGHAIASPVRLMLRSPIVFVLSLYLGLSNGCLYLIYVTLPPLYIESFDFSASRAGSVLLWTSIPAFLICWMSYVIFNNTAKINRRGRFQICFSIFLFWGLCVFGWIDLIHTSWFTPFTISLIVVTGSIAASSSVQFHIIELSSCDPKSAIAGMLIARALFAGLLPLAGAGGPSAYGFKWKFRFIAILTLSLAPLTWYLYRRLPGLSKRNSKPRLGAPDTFFIIGL